MLYSCTKCSYKAGNKNNLYRHLNRKNSCDATHICDKCKKSFKTKCYLTKHLKNIQDCVLIVENSESDIQCKFCNRSYTLKWNLNRHYKTCKVKNGGVQVIYAKLLRENQTKIETIEENKPQLITGDILNYNNIFITNKHSVKNIDFSYLTKPFFANLLESKNVNHIIINMMHQIYNNPDHPENHSVVYYNEEFGYIFNDTKWKLQPLSDIYNIMTLKSIEATKNWKIQPDSCKYNPIIKKLWDSTPLSCNISNKDMLDILKNTYSRLKLLLYKIE